MVARKIQDEQELMRWWADGVTYDEMADRYMEKYNLDVSPGLFSSWRARKGLPTRIVRDADLIPWMVKEEHRFHKDVNMLRLEARVREGKTLNAVETRRLAAWKAELEANDAVIHYNPDTDEGFHWVHREPGDDDLIHKPERPTTKMRPAT